jgi:hypothetical protein
MKIDGELIQDLADVIGTAHADWEDTGRDMPRRLMRRDAFIARRILTRLEERGWRAPAEVVEPLNPQVWISTPRRGVDCHALTSRLDDDANPYTVCGRSTRTGSIVRYRDAVIVHHVELCPKCWPEGIKS